jgi:hypothetical protein
MIETILEKFAQYFYFPRFKKLEHKIGSKLVFKNIPKQYINGWVSCGMTETWQKAGLNVEKGANYFTMGYILNDDSSRFNRNSVEYESWLGGYTVKLASQKPWTAEEHFNLAIADQNSWLKWYGDLKPITTTQGWKLTETGKIQIGQYSGNLYDFGCTTHSDVGRRYNSIKLWLASTWMAVLFNLSNPNLKITGKELRPRTKGKSYEKLKLHGYIAVFDLPENVKVVLYGNGFIDEQKHMDTFTVLKSSLLNAMRSCEIEIV